MKPEHNKQATCFKHKHPLSKQRALLPHVRSASKLFLVAFVSLGLILSGCSKEDKNKAESDKSSEETKAINEGDYSALLPFSPSDAGQKHAQMQTNLTDTLTIGSGLMELSKEYFSSKVYAFRGGKYLDYNTLDASDNNGLLGRTSKRNPNGLNPAVGDVFPTDNGNVKITANDVLLLDIFEYDWYKNKELKGLSLALVLNDELGDEVNPAKVNADKLKLYGEESARKLVNYLRKAKPEIGSNTPIYVALYNASTEDDTLPGTFFDQAYFESKTNAEFEPIHEEWALFPTAKASKLDGTNATYFDRYKASFKDFLTQDIDMIGKGHFKNNELSELRINVTLHAKSADEVIAAVQLLDERLSIFSSNSFKITVVVKCDDVDVATITRNKGTSETVAQTLIL